MKFAFAMVLLAGCAMDEATPSPGSKADERAPVVAGASDTIENDGTRPPRFGNTPHCDPDVEVCPDIVADSGYTWSVQAQIASGNFYTKLTGTFVVPAAPAATFTVSPQQYVAFWPALGDAPGNSVLQPVLYYGFGPQGGGNHWSLECMYADSGGTVVHSNVVTVSAGDTITAALTGTSCNTTTGICSWSCTASDTTHPVTTSAFPAFTTPYKFDEAYGNVNENDNLTSCFYFPSTDSTTFSSIAVYDKTGTHITSPSWINKQWYPTPMTHGNDVPCGFGASHTTTAATILYNGYVCTPGSIQDCCAYSRCTCDGTQACNASGAWGACRNSTPYPYSCP